MTEEITKNDIAFIKISKELHQVRNSVAYLEAFKNYLLRSDGWAKQKVSDLDASKTLTDDLRCFSEILPYVVDNGDKLVNKLNRLQERMRQLEKLVDTYMKGGDILMDKLAR